MKEVTIIDPPSGWRYGFPKIYDFIPSSPNLLDEEYEKEIVEWFLDNGYPQHEINQGSLKWCRYWQEEVDA